MIVPIATVDLASGPLVCMCGSSCIMLQEVMSIVVDECYEPDGLPQALAAQCSGKLSYPTGRRLVMPLSFEGCLKMVNASLLE